MCLFQASRSRCLLQICMCLFPVSSCLLLVFLCLFQVSSFLLQASTTGADVSIASA